MLETISVGDRLKMIRTELGLSQEQMAEKLSMNWYQIKDMEIGKTKLSKQLAKLLYYEFGINDKWLFDEHSNSLKHSLVNQKTLVSQNENVRKSDQKVFVSSSLVQNPTSNLKPQTLNEKKLTNKEKEALALAEFNEDYALVTRYDVRASAGGGYYNDDYVELLQPISFSRAYLHKEGLNPSKCHCINVYGDSMMPTIGSGDIALVNTNEIEIQEGKIFVIYSEDYGLMVKRLRIAKGGVEVVSDNKDYKTIEISRNELKIIGRCVWLGKTI